MWPILGGGSGCSVYESFGVLMNFFHEWDLIFSSYYLCIHGLYI